MRIKTYFVKSVEEAIAQARKDVGDDALLLSSRQGISPDGQWPGYQVVFGITEDSPEAELADTERAMASVARTAAAPAPALAKKIIVTEPAPIAAPAASFA